MADNISCALRIAERLSRLDKEVGKARRLARSLHLAAAVAQGNATTRIARIDLFASLLEISSLTKQLCDVPAEFSAPNPTEG
jgi:hypothetical protein